MKKLLLILAFLVPSPALAAVALISATDMSGNNTVSVDTTTGANRAACVNIGGDLTDNTTAVTVGTDTLTLMTKVQVSGNRFHYSFCGILTVTGTQTVTITGGTLALSTTLLYSGAGTPKNGVTATGNSATPSITASPTPASTSWLAGGTGNDAAVSVAGANTTCRSQGGVCTSSLQQSDSNGVTSPTSLNWSLTPGGNWAAYAVEIPVAAGAAAVATPIQSLVKSFWW